MDLANFIRFKKRHLLKILAASLLTAIMSGLFFFFFRSGANINATVFVNIGAKKTIAAEEKSTALDLVQAADHFTETVQGWFKNPDFLAKIGASLNIEPSISARRQEKQNLLITFSSMDEAAAKKLTHNIQENLLAEIGSYNRNTGAGFQIALFSASYKNASQLLLYLVILFGLIIGGALGMGLCYLSELLGDKVIQEFRAEQILGKKSLEMISSRLKRPEIVGFLAAVMDKSHARNYHLIGVNFNPAELHAMLTKLIPGKKIASFEFPSCTGELINNSGAENLIICKLGQSTARDLLKVKTILQDGFGLIIQE